MSNKEKILEQLANIKLQDSQILTVLEEGAVLYKTFNKLARSMQHPTTEELGARCK